jgi:hypothetical protein
MDLDVEGESSDSESWIFTHVVDDMGGADEVEEDGDEVEEEEGAEGDSEEPAQKQAGRGGNHGSGQEDRGQESGDQASEGSRGEVAARLEQDDFKLGCSHDGGASCAGTRHKSVEADARDRVESRYEPIFVYMIINM